MQQQTLANLAERGAGGRRRGIASICSAHPFVIEATLQRAADDRSTVLIEATCNQVNHRGGYTGMTPAAFRNFVFEMAEAAALPKENILLGGDHLGPNPWKNLPAGEAMQESERMMAAFIEAGFTKIHLDTSMACGGDPVPLPEATIAARAARLAVVAERAAASAGVVPYYVIGTEVPIPGGAHETIDALEVTRPQAAIATAESHRDAFAAAGVGTAYDRVIALVVQPGVEYGSGNVIPYVREKAADLSAALGALPGLVFEAHSTDYQSVECLGALVQDGFAVLKVGPWLTFAMREALYGLDAIARFLRPQTPSLIDAMEQVMLARPADWQPYYGGPVDEQRVARHFSYSDRIRYYWPQPQARAAVDRLLLALQDVALPQTLMSQYLPHLYERVRSGALMAEPRALIIESIKDVLRTYAAACQ